MYIHAKHWVIRTKYLLNIGPYSCPVHELILLLFAVTRYGANYYARTFIGVTHSLTRQGAQTLDGFTTTQLKWANGQPATYQPVAYLNDRHLTAHNLGHPFPYCCETKRTGACVGYASRYTRAYVRHLD